MKSASSRRLEANLPFKSASWGRLQAAGSVLHPLYVQRPDLERERGGADLRVVLSTNHARIAGIAKTLMVALAFGLLYDRIETKGLGRFSFQTASV
jgi:hypothetical protein